MVFYSPVLRWVMGGHVDVTEKRKENENESLPNPSFILLRPPFIYENEAGQLKRKEERDPFPPLPPHRPHFFFLPTLDLGYFLKLNFSFIFSFLRTNARGYSGVSLSCVTLALNVSFFFFFFFLFDFCSSAANRPVMR
eukprot:TRINITY_DN9413_c0_g4_i1.p1 TRINITY_DN9413_c0_g4~~TRINITY_DN9413_c0_g4_i1.p1  ORF type:complete len:138 (-),score=2.65 TRINITY_DN9413_c0_g4_i1:179-592(-)